MSIGIGIVLSASLIASIWLALGILKVGGSPLLKLIKLAIVFIPILGPVFYTFMFKAPRVNPDRFRYINQTVGRDHRQDAFKFEMQVMKMRIKNLDKKQKSSNKEKEPEIH